MLRLNGPSYQIIQTFIMESQNLKPTLQSQKRQLKLGLLRSSLGLSSCIHSKRQHYMQKYQEKLNQKDSQQQNSPTLQRCTSEQTLHSSNQLPYDCHEPFEDKYQLLEKIGEGAHGVVKKCLDRKHGKIYAVKVLKMQDEQIVNLKRNFVCIEGLQHPSLIKYKAMYFSEKKSCCYLVMEYAPFPSLKEFNLQNQQELKRVFYQILESVEYLHESKICHRDIKPENILYDSETGKIKIIDFGISKYVIERGYKVDMLTNTGTLQYKAPEMFLGGGYDQSVDLWAVGVMLYEAIARKTPFLSLYHNQTISSILSMKVGFQDTVWEQNSFARNLIQRLLKKREDRLNASEAKNHFWFASESALGIQNTLKDNEIMAVSALYDKVLKQRNFSDINKNKSENMKEGSPRGCLRKEILMQNWVSNQKVTDLDLNKSSSIDENERSDNTTF